MGILNELRAFHEIGKLNNIPVRMVNAIGNIMGGALTMLPEDTEVETIAVTESFLNFIDVDLEAAAAILHHEMGHIQLKHYDYGNKVVVNQAYEEAADAFALQFVTKDALLRGISFSVKLNQQSIKHCSWFRRVCNKIEMSWRMGRRAYLIGRLSQHIPDGGKSRAEFQWSEQVVTHLTTLGLQVPKL